MTDVTCSLFAHPGQDNTAATVSRVAARVAELDLRHVVAATCTGRTALALRTALPSAVTVVAVTHQVGFAGPGEDELPAEGRAALEAEGVPILTTTHLFGGIDRACRFKAEGLYPAEIVAHTLRVLGQGVKVGVEVAVMALDAGLIPYGEEVVAVGGSGRGADAACVLLPAHAHAVFDLQIREILCMPRVKRKG